MTFLPDDALARLRKAAVEPDLSGTKYEIVRFLARGGMSNVYLARDRELDREVALKVVDFTETEEGGRPRFLREARLLARVEHPGIIPVHDAGILPDGRAFFVMKYAGGRTFADYCKDLPPFRDALRIYQKICEAVAFAHSRAVIHRDLKPSNIMIGPFGEALVLDWGVAREITKNDAANIININHPGLVAGTPGFMAPEQERGDLALLNERTDVFALGAILQYLTRGFASRIRARESRRLAAIIQKAMSPSPADRYESAGALSDEIARFMDDLPISARRETLLERAALFATRNIALLSIVAAYLFMRMLILVIFRQ